MAVQVRPARADDCDAIVGVMDGWWGRPVSHPLPRLFLDHFASSSRVAEDQQGLAGFLVAFPSPADSETIYLHFVGVRPDRRRTGLTRTLYQDIAGYARRQGREHLYAITAPTNTTSIRFHQRMGFSVSAPIVDYNGLGRPMVVFQLELDRAQHRGRIAMTGTLCCDGAPLHSHAVTGWARGPAHSSAAASALRR